MDECKSDCFGIMPDGGACHYHRKPSCAQKISSLESEKAELEMRLVNQYANAERLIAWINDPKRKMPIHAFTEGPDRQIAYAVEELFRKMFEHLESENGRLRKAMLGVINNITMKADGYGLVHGTHLANLESAVNTVEEALYPKEGKSWG